MSCPGNVPNNGYSQCHVHDKGLASRRCNLRHRYQLPSYLISRDKNVKSWQELSSRYPNHWLQRNLEMKRLSGKVIFSTFTFSPFFCFHFSSFIHSSLPSQRRVLDDTIEAYLNLSAMAKFPASYKVRAEAMFLLRIQIRRHLNVRDPTWRVSCTACKNDLRVSFKVLRVRTSYLKDTNLHLLR